MQNMEDLVLKRNTTKAIATGRMPFQSGILFPFQFIQKKNSRNEPKQIERHQLDGLVESLMW